MIQPLLKPKDQPRRREPNPRVTDDGRLIFKKPSKAWDEQRFKVYSRDRGRCVDCGPDSPVLYFKGGEWYNNAEIDHDKPKRMGRDAFTDDRLENLKTRCARHHQEKHGRGKRAEEETQKAGHDDQTVYGLPS